MGWHKTVRSGTQPANFQSDGRRLETCRVRHKTPVQTGHAGRTDETQGLDRCLTSSMCAPQCRVQYRWASTSRSISPSCSPVDPAQGDPVSAYQRPRAPGTSDPALGVCHPACQSAYGHFSRKPSPLRISPTTIGDMGKAEQEQDNAGKDPGCRASAEHRNAGARLVHPRALPRWRPHPARVRDPPPRAPVQDPQRAAPPRRRVLLARHLKTAAC